MDYQRGKRQAWRIIRLGVGWLLTLIGFGIILAGILMNMDIYFRPTTLYNTLLMLVILAGGLGLIIRSFRAQGDRPQGDP